MWTRMFEDASAIRGLTSGTNTDESPQGYCLWTVMAMSSRASLGPVLRMNVEIVLMLPGVVLLAGRAGGGRALINRSRPRHRRAHRQRAVIKS